ncbi:MAG TPA: acVLRF1 family peptidyl-tRNA hydrolase [Micromonosporaceae bacterium]
MTSGEPGGQHGRRASGRPAAGGGRWVEVPPERLERWIAGFGERHGAVSHTVDDGVLRLRAFDSAEAECLPPPATPRATDLDGFVSGALRPGRIGLLLARKSAYAVGIADGLELTVSKVDSHYVQSRTAAGGWSQQRFARRRANQAKAAAGDATETVVRLLVPEAASLAAVVTGGDRRTVETILDDRRLDQISQLVHARFLDVPDPKQSVLRQAAVTARSIRIRLLDPE